MNLFPTIAVLSAAIALVSCSRSDLANAGAESACVAAGPVEAARWVHEKKQSFPYDDPDGLSFLSPQLHDLLVAERNCERRNEGLCSLGANPWINAQDGDMLPPINFELTSSTATTATVRMSYRFGWTDQIEKAASAANRFEFLRDPESGCWLLDDLAGRVGISLKALLQPDPSGA